MTEKENIIDNPQWVMEAIDREISHYRKRVGQVFFYGFLLEVLIIGGEKKILLSGVDPTAKVIVYTIFFAAIPMIAALLGHEYLSRIRMLKQSRESLLRSFSLENVFPNGQDHFVNEIWTLWSVLAVLSAAGASIFWLNTY